MSRLDSFVIGTKVKAQKMCEKAKDAVLTAKKPGDSQIVVALVLIAVAVGLCIIFREQIETIMANLINTISQAIADLASGTAYGSGGGTGGGE